MLFTYWGVVQTGIKAETGVFGLLEALGAAHAAPMGSQGVHMHGAHELSSNKKSLHNLMPLRVLGR